jgi:tRNA pseudouridine55 synthase
VDGVLVIDKPRGPTSHDIVAAARRTLREKGIGHTGTLDPLATGVLPLALGRATRLVRFLTASDKDYEATIRFGLTTDSYDITGTETGRTDAVPSPDAVARAVGSLRGRYDQMPPEYSAKRIEGRRAYDLARRDEAVALAPVPVHVERAEILEIVGARARVGLTCSAGFYVRAFAHALGQAVGTGACLEALRRTRSGEFTLDQAAAVGDLQSPATVSARLIPLPRLLPGFPTVRVTEQGRALVSHGREIGPGDYEPLGGHPAEWTRLLDAQGALVAVARPGRGDRALHPAVVLI